MAREKGNGLRRMFYYYLYLLVIWGFFRLLFRFPLAVEEFWFKPLIWLLPLLMIWMNEEKRVKFFDGNPIRAVIWGLGLGIVWLLISAVVSLGRVGAVSLVAGMGLSDILGAAVATAIVEELAFSGYIFQRVFQAVKGAGTAMGITGALFALIHIPIGVFVYEFNPGQLLGFLIVVAIVEMGGNYLMYRTRNVIAPMVAHFMWAVAAVVVG